jgi:exosortase A-associated hydrolase 2
LPPDLPVVNIATERFYFERAVAGARFCTLLRPRQGAPRGALLLVPPFAEEANKTRRLCMEIARSCAGAGWAVLLGDLAGTGDSEGDIGEIGWTNWVDDVAAFAARVRSESSGPFVILGLRLGALLAAAALDGGLDADGLFLLCPVTNGKQALTQFLRVGAAADMGAGEAATIDTRPLRARLAAGENIEIAGYSLSPALAGGIEACQIGAASALPPRLAWLELVATDPPAATPAVEMLAGRLRDTGRSLDLRLMTGPAFWQTQEIEHLPQLPARICDQLGAFAECLA